MAIRGKAPYMKLNDGNEIPIVGLGTFGLGKGQAFVEVPEALLWAIKAGYRHIDTAKLYNNEDVVGKQVAVAIEKGLVTREQMFITSKLPHNRHARHEVVPTLKESLAQLKMDYVDLYLIHSPFSLKEDGSLDNIDYLDTWKGMEEAKELGLAKSIGVGNFNEKRLDRLIANCKIMPAVNQIEVNPAMTSEKLVAHCQKLGVTVTASCPLGYLVERKQPGSRPPYADDPVLTEIARRYGKTTPQVVLRYLIDRGVIPIPKSTNKDRIAKNIDLFDFKLTDDEVATISSFNQDFNVLNQLLLKRLKDFPL